MYAVRLLDCTVCTPEESSKTAPAGWTHAFLHRSTGWRLTGGRDSQGRPGRADTRADVVGMVRQGQVRQVRTPVYLRLGKWRSTVQAYLPYRPRRRDGSVAAAGQCAEAACAAADEEAEWIAVPLSAQAEFALAAQIKAAFGLAVTDGSTVVGVRQEHYAPLTPLCMLPRLPAQCLEQELEVVLAPAAQRLEMQPLPALELDASAIIGCAARLRACGTALGDDKAFAELLCSGLSLRGILRMVLLPAQVAKISRATVAFDKFCCESTRADRRQHMLSLCGEGSGKWIGYTRQPRREFFQVRKTGELLGRSKIYDNLARETWLGGALGGCSEVNALRKLKADLQDAGACQSTITHVDERLLSLVAEQVAELAVSELRVWLQCGSVEDIATKEASSDQVDKVSRLLAARLSAGVRSCGNLSDSDLEFLRIALASPVAGSSPSATGSTASGTTTSYNAADRCRALLFGAAMDVVRSHYCNLSSTAGDSETATDGVQVDVVGWIERFRDAVACASSTNFVDAVKHGVECDSAASESSTPTTTRQLYPDNCRCDTSGSSRVYASVEFEEAASDMFDMLHELSVALLHVLAAGMGLEANAASGLCDTATPGPTEFSSSVLRLYRYFGGSRPEAACGVHADIGLLTLSPRADIPGLTVLDGAEYAWVDAEDGVDANVCSVFPGECLGPWSSGRFQAPLHYVNEEAQATAEAEADQTVRDGELEHNVQDGCAGEGAVGESTECSASTIRHSWPFFFRSPGHAIVSPPSTLAPQEIGADDDADARPSSTSGKAIGTAAFVESEVFGRRAWRRPKGIDGQRPEY